MQQEINVRVIVTVPDGSEEAVRMSICDLLDRKHSNDFQIEEWENA